MSRKIFDSEHEMFRDSVRNFMQKEILPYRDKWHEQGIVDREAYLKAGQQGLLLMWADEKYGGAGISDFRYEQVLIEEHARYGDAGFFMTLHSRKHAGCRNASPANTFWPSRSPNPVPAAMWPASERKLKTRVIITC
jgi:alkylation response protein AidB-like acyl-CoA dehydrogenase